MTGLLLAMLAWPSSAAAQQDGSASTKLAAQALFDEAQQLVTDEQWQQACPKFLKSMQLDRAVGTQLNLARCYAQIGKTASAWLHYTEGAAAAAAAGQAERAEAAKQLANELAASLSKMRIVVEDKSEGLEISRDGETVPPAVWGALVSLDPGSHEIVAKAPGKRTFRANVEVAAEGDEVEIVIAPLQDDTPVLSPAEAAALDGRKPIANTIDEPTTVSDEPTASQESGVSTHMAVGISAGVVGVIGVGIGAGFGLAAQSRQDESLQNCLASDINRCNEQGLAAREDAQSAAAVSTGMFVAGGVLLATGVALMITAPSDEADSSAIRIDTLPVVGGADGVNGLLVRGRW